MRSLSIIVPTLAGREAFLERALASIELTAPGAEVIVVHDKPSCGVAWQEGAERATGDMLCFSADDITFPYVRWAETAAATVAAGSAPAPLIFYPDGRVQYCGATSDEMEPDGSLTMFTRVPFLSRAWWDEHVAPMLPIHYFTDNYVSFRLREQGIVTRVCLGFKCIHYQADVGVLPWYERIGGDRDIYQAATGDPLT